MLEDERPILLTKVLIELESAHAACASRHKLEAPIAAHLLHVPGLRFSKCSGMSAFQAQAAGTFAMR
jgi:hypothetical protein